MTLPPVATPDAMASCAVVEYPFVFVSPIFHDVTAAEHAIVRKVSGCLYHTQYFILNATDTKYMLALFAAEEILIVHEVTVGFGRIVTSEKEVPNMLANLV
jgi:hypothetical protein